MLPARLTRWKGAELLLDAMAALPDKASYCVLVGADQGRQTYAAALVSRAERLGLGGRVRFAGHCDDMPAALMLADVVVSASLKPEPFGRAVIEAQAMGRPVVVSDHGGAAETVQPGVTGWRVPPGDAAALAEALRHALSLDADERAALAERARDSVLTYFTTASMQQATLAVYRELLD
jgi:glycosyltransferase involved in cell wall biosynthesis